MPDSIPASRFADILLQDIPLIDVRAPVEFQQGALPASSNLPVLDDAQRELVGTAYKNRGQQAAINLGQELVSGDVKTQRMAAWLELIERQPNALLYCFRGGLRSQTVQQWLSEQGVSIPLIEGGYKALRNYLLSAIESFSKQNEYLIVAGKTGTGKTHLLNKISYSVDLEGLAHHRGSAFGRRVTPQPSQVNFENNLAIALLKLDSGEDTRIFLEDESRSIGAMSIPLNLHSKMLESSIAVVEESLEYRVNTILNDYIIDNFQEFKNIDADNHQALFEDFLLSALSRIQRRLGGENYQAIHSLTVNALELQFRTGDTSAHRDWISALLQKYYDPMYEYQLDKKSHRVVFRGNHEEFLAWSSHINKAEELST